MTVYVKEVLQANGRFRLTLDPDVTPERVAQLKKALLRRKSRWNKRRELAELEVGEEILGKIVKASSEFLAAVCLVVLCSFRFDYGVFRSSVLLLACATPYVKLLRYTERRGRVTAERSGGCSTT